MYHEIHPLRWYEELETNKDDQVNSTELVASYKAMVLIADLEVSFS